MVKISLLVLSFFVAIAIEGNSAWASLGEKADSVASDRRALSAKNKSEVTRNGYTVHEIASDSVTVREYLSPSGVVFAVAWNGRVHPDLTGLLGSYAGEYKNALRQTSRKPGRRASRVETGRVVVEKGGHMRNVQGRAYAPALVPEGVNIDEIR